MSLSFLTRNNFYKRLPTGLLQPMSTNTQPSQPPKVLTPATKLGATWADTTGAININVDNLLAPRSPKSGPAPTINQLKSSPNSPAHIAQPNPMMGYNFMNNNFAAPNMNVTNPNVPSPGMNLNAPLGMNIMGMPPGMNNNLPFANQNTFLQ